MTTRKLDFQGKEVAVSTNDQWELAEGGKALKIRRQVNSPRGADDFTLYFSKQ